MNWIESSIEGSKLFICSGCTCTCREAISDQEKEDAGRLAESFYCRRDFSGCLAKASPSNSVEAMDSVNSNAAREGSDGSNCDRVFILFDIFHCSNCDDELQEHRIVYGEIIENIDQIREELNGMRQRLKKLLLRNCSTEFPPMESITSNVSHTSSGVIDDCVHGSAINDTEIKNKENEIRKQRSMSEDKDKETADHKKELITPNVSYEWSGVINKRVHSSVPKDTEIKHQEDDSRKQRSSSEDKIKETDDHKNESITSSVSYEWPGVIDNRVHGLVSKDTKIKQKEDDIRKQRSRSEDKTKEAADHKKELMTSKVSYESSLEIDKGVHGLVLKDTEMKKKEGDIRKQRSMGEDKEKEAVNNKKESITSNISYERSEVFENPVHDAVLNDTGIRHKEESITSSVSYEWPGVIDNRVQGSFIKDTKTKQKEDDIRKQRSRSEEKAKEAVDHKKDDIRKQRSMGEDKEKETFDNKTESITSNISYELSGVFENPVHDSVLNVTGIRQKEDDIRKQRSTTEDKTKEAADHKKELMTSKVSYESSPEIDKGVHGLFLKDTEMKKKEDDIRKQRSMGEDKEKETVDHEKESIMSNISYERSGVFENHVHDSVLNDTGIRHKEDDIRKQKSSCDGKTNETDYHKKESITANVSYDWSRVIDNCVHGSVSKDTKTIHKEDDIRKQNLRNEDKAKEAVDHKKDDIQNQRSRSEDKAKETFDHKKESITSTVSNESPKLIDNRVHGSVLKHTVESVTSNISYGSSEEIDNHVHVSVIDAAEIKNKEESITSNVPRVSSGVIDYHVHGSFLNDTEIKNKETSTYKQNTKPPGRQRLQRKEDIWPGSKVIRYGGDGSVMETEIKTDDKTRPRRQRLERGSDVSGDGVSGSVLKDAEIKLKDIQDDDIPNPWSNSNLKAKETIDDNKFQDYVPNPVSTSEDESEETVDDNKETVDSIPSNDSKSEGFEVIAEDVPEIKPKDTSSHCQKPRPRRQRLQRKGKVWPGYEMSGDGVHGSILMEIEIKHASPYNQKTRQRRQRLQRKV